MGNWVCLQHVQHSRRRRTASGFFHKRRVCAVVRLVHDEEVVGLASKIRPCRRHGQVLSLDAQTGRHAVQRHVWHHRARRRPVPTWRRCTVRAHTYTHAHTHLLRLRTCAEFYPHFAPLLLSSSARRLAVRTNFGAGTAEWMHCAWCTCCLHCSASSRCGSLPRS